MTAVEIDKLIYKEMLLSELTDNKFTQMLIRIELDVVRNCNCVPSKNTQRLLSTAVTLSANLAKFDPS